MWWFLCCLMGGAVSCTGLYFSNRLAKRKNFFNSLYIFSQNCKNFINYSHSTFGEMLELLDKSNNTDINNLYKSLKLELEKNKKVELHFWENSEFWLKKDEKLSIKKFFCGFGKTDIKTQMADINNFHDYLQNKTQYVTKEYESKNKLYVNLSIMAGVGIIIVLI